MSNDHIYNVQDVVGVVNVAFRGAALPLIHEIPDINGDGIASDVVDVVREVDHVFRSKPQPSP
jgi:hypothetical protein